MEERVRDLYEVVGIADLNRVIRPLGRGEHGLGAAHSRQDGSATKQKHELVVAGVDMRHLDEVLTQQPHARTHLSTRDVIFRPDWTYHEG